jgi:hypothetical protein
MGKCWQLNNQERQMTREMNNSMPDLKKESSENNLTWLIFKLKLSGL